MSQVAPVSDPRREAFDRQVEILKGETDIDYHIEENGWPKAPATVELATVCQEKVWSILLFVGRDWSPKPVNPDYRYVLVNEDCHQAVLTHEELCQLTRSKKTMMVLRPSNFKVIIKRLIDIIEKETVVQEKLVPILDLEGTPVYPALELEKCANYDSFDLLFGEDLDPRLTIGLKNGNCYGIGKLASKLLLGFLEDDLSNSDFYGGELWTDCQELKRILRHPHLEEGLRQVLTEDVSEEMLEQKQKKAKSLEQQIIALEGADWERELQQERRRLEEERAVATGVNKIVLDRQIRDLAQGGIKHLLGQKERELGELKSEIPELSRKAANKNKIDRWLSSGQIHRVLEEIFIRECCKAMDVCEFLDPGILLLLGKIGWDIHGDSSGRTDQYLGHKTEMAFAELIDLAANRLSESEWKRLSVGMVMDYKTNPQTDQVMTFKAIMSDRERCGHKLGGYLMTLYVKYYHQCYAGKEPLDPYYFQLDELPALYFSYAWRNNEVGNFDMFYILAFDTLKKRIWRVIGRPTGPSPSGGFGQLAAGEADMTADRLAKRQKFNEDLDRLISDRYAELYKKCQEQFEIVKERESIAR
jgi:hypothetical protein